MPLVWTAVKCCEMCILLGELTKRASLRRPTRWLHSNWAQHSEGLAKNNIAPHWRATCSMGRRSLI